MGVKLSARILIAGTATALWLHSAAATAQTNWATFGFDRQRTGYNTEEATLSPNTVPSLTLKWIFDLGSEGVTAQPVEAYGIVYTASTAGTVYALDQASGQVIWRQQLGVTQTDCPDMPNGTFGNIATPTVDEGNFRLLIVSGDGLLHALDGAIGNEWPGYPIQVMDEYNLGQTFDYGSPIYDYINSVVDVPTAGACDNPPYRGQVVQITNDPAQPPVILNRWFTDGANGPDGGGIWGPGGISAEPDFSATYTATGNALTSPENYGYADQVVRLDTNLNVQASNGPKISDGDFDFGSTPVLYQPPGCPAQLAALNKNGQLFVYNRNAIGDGPMQVLQISSAKVSGFDSGFIGAVAYDPVFNQIYVANNLDDDAGFFYHGLIALAPQPDCSLALQWQQTVGGNSGPAIPPVAANGVVYHSSGMAAVVYAFSAATGQYLWDSSSSPIGSAILASPMVVNGQLYIADWNGGLFCFGLSDGTASSRSIIKEPAMRAGRRGAL